MRGVYASCFMHVLPRIKKEKKEKGDKDYERTIQHCR